MSEFIRVKHQAFEEIYNVMKDGIDATDMNEWHNPKRADDDSWVSRYKYEATLVQNAINENFPTKDKLDVLEIGAGIGSLSNFVQTGFPKELNYHLIDKPLAEKAFKDRGYKGTFFVKDISIDMDTSGLLPRYDLVICNDVLEHLLAPSLVVQKIHSLVDENSLVFISVPNWRMGHQLLYRGLFDYDNFLFFMYIHEFTVVGVYPSVLQTPNYDKLDSEKCMPDELLRSWNFYFICKKEERREKMTL